MDSAIGDEVNEEIQRLKMRIEKLEKDKGDKSKDNSVPYCPSPPYYFPPFYPSPYTRPWYPGTQMPPFIPWLPEVWC